MVVVTNLMSKFITKIQPSINVSASMSSESSMEIDEKTRAIIEAAIKMHIQR
jgi:oxaloacetate decarboxylase gamma subunit